MPRATWSSAKVIEHAYCSIIFTGSVRTKITIDSVRRFLLIKLFLVSEVRSWETFLAVRGAHTLGGPTIDPPLHDSAGAAVRPHLMTQRKPPEKLFCRIILAKFTRYGDRHSVQWTMKFGQWIMSETNLILAVGRQMKQKNWSPISMAYPLFRTHVLMKVEFGSRTV